jgi:hypothetical protein
MGCTRFEVGGESSRFQESAVARGAREAMHGGEEGGAQFSPLEVNASFMLTDDIRRRLSLGASKSGSISRKERSAFPGGLFAKRSIRRCDGVSERKIPSGSTLSDLCKL